MRAHARSLSCRSLGASRVGLLFIQRILAAVRFVGVTPLAGHPMGPVSSLVQDGTVASVSRCWQFGYSRFQLTVGPRLQCHCRERYKAPCRLMSDALPTSLTSNLNPIAS